MQAVKEKWLAENKNVPLDHYAQLSLPQQIPLKILRVNQLDALILDQELNEILKFQFNKIFALFPVWSAVCSVTSSCLTLQRIAGYTPELSLFLDLIVFYCSVWKRGTTYGNQLQNLKLSFPENGVRRQLKLIAYAMVHVVIPYDVEK
jgi:hypothetical protein